YWRSRPASCWPQPERSNRERRWPQVRCRACRRKRSSRQAAKNDAAASFDLPRRDAPRRATLPGSSLRQLEHSGFLILAIDLFIEAFYLRILFGFIDDISEGK